MDLFNYILIFIGLMISLLLLKNAYDDIKYNMSKGMSLGRALITTPDYYKFK